MGECWSWGKKFDGPSRPSRAPMWLIGDCWLPLVPKFQRHSSSTLFLTFCCCCLLAFFLQLLLSLAHLIAGRGMLPRMCVCVFLMVADCSPMFLLGDLCACCCAFQHPQDHITRAELFVSTHRETHTHRCTPAPPPLRFPALFRFGQGRVCVCKKPNARGVCMYTPGKHTTAGVSESPLQID